jgi:hypothetical protein
MKTLRILFITCLGLVLFLIIPSYVNINSQINSKISLTTLSYLPYSSSIFVGTIDYASNDTNSSEITPDELHKNIETAREKISNIMMNNTTDIPFNMVGIDIINSTLDVGIDSAKATLSAEQYKEKIREIIGNIPITLTFGHIQLLANDTSGQNNSSTSLIMSPLKQFKSGIQANKVNCQIGLQLILKAEDGTPACVTPDTSKILIERGWAKS